MQSSFCKTGSQTNFEENKLILFGNSIMQGGYQIFADADRLIITTSAPISKTFSLIRVSFYNTIVQTFNATIVSAKLH
jgi:hypothetical protein